MSSKRWDREEKTLLIRLFSEGKTFKEIGEKLDRSESAIRLRLQTIVYEGIAKGMRAADVADMLGADSDIVTQMFYTHRDFKESRGEEVISLQAASKLLFGSSKRGSAKKSVDDLVEDPDKSFSNNANALKEPSGEVKKLMDQNRIMEAIINNRDLRKKIKKLHKENKLTKEEKNLLERILSS